MRTKLLIGLAVMLALALGAGVIAARPAAVAKPKPPSGLHIVAGAPPPPSALDQANVGNDMKQLQLYQAQMQILTYQFEQTKAALAVKLKTLERDGWDLDLQTWQYVPKGSAPVTK